MPRLDTLSLDMSRGCIGAHAEFDKRFLNIFPQIKYLAVAAPLPLQRWVFSPVLDSVTKLVNLRHLSLLLTPNNLSDWLSKDLATVTLVALHLEVRHSVRQGVQQEKQLVDAVTSVQDGVSIRAEEAYFYGDWSLIRESPEYASMSGCWREGNAPFSNFEEYNFV
ncbi:hypothetical protein JCM3765_002753 [Sporobolomyces pararoseus]